MAKHTSEQINDFHRVMLYWFKKPRTGFGYSHDSEQNRKHWAKCLGTTWEEGIQYLCSIGLLRDLSLTEKACLLKLAELKGVLKAHNLKASGNKKKISAKITAAIPDDARILVASLPLHHIVTDDGNEIAQEYRDKIVRRRATVHDTVFALVQQGKFREAFDTTRDLTESIIRHPDGFSDLKYWCVFSDESGRLITNWGLVRNNPKVGFFGREYRWEFSQGRFAAIQNVQSVIGMTDTELTKAKMDAIFSTIWGNFPVFASDPFHEAINVSYYRLNDPEKILEGKPMYTAVKDLLVRKYCRYCGCDQNLPKSDCSCDNNDVEEALLSNVQRALLKRFRKVMRLHSWDRERWAFLLGQEYFDAIQEIQKQGLVREPTFEEKVAEIKISEIKVLLRKYDLKVSGKKPEIVDRALANVPKNAMADALKRLPQQYVCTEQGKTVLLQYETDVIDLRSRARDQIIDQFRGGNMEGTTQAAKEYHLLIPEPKHQERVGNTRKTKDVPLDLTETNTTEAIRMIKKIPRVPSEELRALKERSLVTLLLDSRWDDDIPKSFREEFWKNQEHIRQTQLQKPLT